jgi:hypothetical protein
MALQLLINNKVTDDIKIVDIGQTADCPKWFVYILRILCIVG